MCRPVGLFLLLTALTVPAVAVAEPLTYQPSISTRPNLDHHDIYTWRIDGVSKVGDLVVGNPNHVITSMRLYFDDLRSLGDAANRRFTRLLDGLMQTRIPAEGLSPIASADGQDSSYQYAEAQIASLTDYILNGNDFALGLDPHRYFDSDYLKTFIEKIAAPKVVPEPVSLLLVGTGLAGLVRLRVRRHGGTRDATARQVRLR